MENNKYYTPEFNELFPDGIWFEFLDDDNQVGPSEFKKEWKSDYHLGSLGDLVGIKSGAVLNRKDEIHYLYNYDMKNGTNLVSKKVRAKYLNVEDISFYFEHKPEYSLKGVNEKFQSYYNARMHPDQPYRYEMIYVEYYPDLNKMIVKADTSDSDEPEKIFEGIIKNYNEFMTLLKFLNIDTKLLRKQNTKADNE
jgi:hypothetical protein